MLNAAAPRPTATSRRTVRGIGEEFGPRGGERLRLADGVDPRRGGVARLLLPQGEQVDHHRQRARALNDLDQLDRREVMKQRADHQPRDQHADQQHDVHQRDDARPRVGPARDRSRARGRRSGPYASPRRPSGRRAPAPTSPTVGDPVVSPDMISSANGMIAKPPNCSSVPNQIYGTRFHPRIER